MKIELKNLGFSPEGKVVFTKFNYCFSSKGKYLVQGPSGCGKSSLLKFISSLEEASEGEIIVNDQPLLDYYQHRKNCQWLRQSAHIYDKSVHENLILALEYHQLAIPTDKELKAYIEKLFPEGLELQQNALELSGGQKHRLALLRAFLLKPQALLCDEISAGLDQTSRELSEDFISNYCSEMTVIFVSHIEESFHSSTNFKRLAMSREGLREL